MRSSVWPWDTPNFNYQLFSTINIHRGIPHPNSDTWKVLQKPSFGNPRTSNPSVATRGTPWLPYSSTYTINTENVPVLVYHLSGSSYSWENTDHFNEDTQYTSRMKKTSNRDVGQSGKVCNKYLLYRVGSNKRRLKSPNYYVSREPWVLSNQGPRGNIWF